jgi:cytidyltransferase-like protein
MAGYDYFVYTPLQKILTPLVSLVPRYLGRSDKYPIFTANIVTVGRTFLIVPVAWFLKYDKNELAFLCVLFHDFLDHLDGIVAKVHSTKYPGHDDPLLGGLLDALCDKIVNVFCLWTIIQSVNFEAASFGQSLGFLAICYGVCAYETVIGIVRVQDYFNAKFKRDLKSEDAEKKKDMESSSSSEAAKENKQHLITTTSSTTMEGKLKEKLESTGIALLCMSASSKNSSPIINPYGIVGLICLLLSLRMAHKSLKSLKLKSLRNAVVATTTTTTKPNQEKHARKHSADNLLHFINSNNETTTTNEEIHHPNFEHTSMKMVNFVNDEIEVESSETYSYKKKRSLYLEDQTTQAAQNEAAATAAFLLPVSRHRTNKTTQQPPHHSSAAYFSSSDVESDTRVDKVYTIGCFDLFHQGHVNLIQRMRKYGKKIIVGVHDSRSIYQLKSRVPIDSTEKRMLNVKTVADEVFCIADTDPSNFMTCIVNLRKNETGMFVRGDDMPNFPSRNVVEKLMPIKLLTYTAGVSSTQIRKEQFSHIAPNDISYMERNE